MIFGKWFDFNRSKKLVLEDIANRASKGQPLKVLPIYLDEEKSTPD